MKIFEPNEYVVDIEKEEIEILKKAEEILNTFHREMSKKDCTVLVGGCDDTVLVGGCDGDITFDLDKIIEMKHFLSDFLEDIPHKMY